MDCTARRGQPTNHALAGRRTGHSATPPCFQRFPIKNYTPVFTIKAAGDLELYVDIDGVRSNTVRVSFY